MTFTHKLSKRLALIKASLVLGLALFACTRDHGSTDTTIPHITRLVLVPESVTVSSSQTFQLKVYGRTEADDSVAPSAQDVSWTTSNASVATVAAGGIVTSHAEGSATITATTDSVTATSNVTVTPPPVIPPGEHSGWHVAPSGSSTNNGSAAKPWALSYALSGASGLVQPGDTVWLRGGTYRGKFTATVAGAAGRPVVFRQYPGERAVIDVAGATSTTSRGDAFVVRGPWTVWWGFEMMSSDPVRDTDVRPNMMINNASNTKYIHLVVHDGGIGFFNYPSASNVEFNGNIVYNNGWQRAKGGGHALYLKSATGPVIVRDNIAFNQYGYGIHVYTDAGAGQLVNLTLDGNVSFNNGAVTLQYNTSANANILIGGEEPVKANRLLNNMTYFSPGYGVYNLMMGYGDFANDDLTLTDNYLVGGSYVLTMGRWTRVTATGNHMLGSGRVVQVKDTTLAGYVWTANSYSRDPAAAAWRYDGTDYSFSSWKSNTGLGTTDAASPNMPGTPQIFVRPSLYELGRATIVVYNWGGRPSVDVDLAAVLPPGTRYEVRNVQNWFGTPVTAGTYAGAPITLPMDGVAPPTPVGGFSHTPPRTGPNFDVFVVLPVN